MPQPCEQRGGANAPTCNKGVRKLGKGQDSPSRNDRQQQTVKQWSASAVLRNSRFWKAVVQSRCFLCIICIDVAEGARRGTSLKHTNQPLHPSLRNAFKLQLEHKLQQRERASGGTAQAREKLQCLTAVSRAASRPLFSSPPQRSQYF